MYLRDYLVNMVLKVYYFTHTSYVHCLIITTIISIFRASSTYWFTLNIKLTNGWVSIASTVNRLESQLGSVSSKWRPKFNMRGLLLLGLLLRVLISSDPAQFYLSICMLVNLVGCSCGTSFNSFNRWHSYSLCVRTYYNLFDALLSIDIISLCHNCRL